MDKKKRIVMGIFGFSLMLCTVLIASPNARYWGGEIFIDPIKCIAKVGLAKCTYDKPLPPEGGMARNILKMSKEK